MHALKKDEESLSLNSPTPPLPRRSDNKWDAPIFIGRVAESQLPCQKHQDYEFGRIIYLAL
jgi:hypothetical protein